MSDESIVTMWRTVERMVVRTNDYADKLQRWDGPIYKSERAYLTHEGWPLGSICWYVALDLSGYRLFICAHTPQEAVERAAAIVAFFDANPNASLNDIRHLHLDPTAPWAKDTP